MTKRRVPRPLRSALTATGALRRRRSYVPSMFDVVIGFRVGLDVLLAQRLIETCGEFTGGVEAARPQQLISRRDLDENAERAPRRNGHANERNLQPENVVAQLVEAQPLGVAVRIPPFQLDDELHSFGVADRGNAEQVAYVDQAEATDLHMVACQLRTGADQRGLASSSDFHRVVRD